jgi:hypothetical protein
MKNPGKIKTYYTLAQLITEDVPESMIEWVDITQAIKNAITKIRIRRVIHAGKAYS